MLAFISTPTTNVLYDAREEATSQIDNNLYNLINNLSTPILSGANPVKLITNVNPAYIIYYEELFVFYLTNSYLEIGSSDLIKISSWLNNQWNNFLNSKSIFSSSWIQTILKTIFLF